VTVPYSPGPFITVIVINANTGLGPVIRSGVTRVFLVTTAIGWIPHATHRITPRFILSIRIATELAIAKIRIPDSSGVVAGPFLRRITTLIGITASATDALESLFNAAVRV
jgi:hypothetical protein